MATFALIMKGVVRCFALILFLLSNGSIAAERPPEDDHLIPAPTRSDSRKYRELLAQKLGLDATDRARVVFNPSFTPETSLSLHFQTGSKTTYELRYAEASESIWQATDGGRLPQEASAIFSRKFAAPLPPTTAKLVEQAWRKMLTAPNTPRPIDPPPYLQAMDGTVAEFSVTTHNGKRALGEMYFPTGPKTKALVELADALIEFVKASKGDRAALEARIQREAAALLRL